MSPMTYTFVILAITVFLFVWGKLRSDLVALLSLLALVAGDVLSANEVLSGFSDSTVIMIAALFVVGEGLSRTGVTAWLSQQIVAVAGSSQMRVLIVLMLGTAFLSAFISNTGAVATLLPAIIAITWRIDSLPSKMLIPVAFAANAGGLLTLTGTPPNIVVSDVLIAAGFAPFGYFEYALIGLPLLVVTIVYLVTLGQRLLPAKQTGDRPEDLDASIAGVAESFALQGKIYLAFIGIESSLAGKSLAECALGHDYTVSVLHIDQDAGEFYTEASSRARRQQRILQRLYDFGIGEDVPGAATQIEVGDILTVKGSSTAIHRAASDFHFEVEEVDTTDVDLSHLLVTPEIGVAEVLITPRSVYIGQTIQAGNFAEKFDVQVISIRRGEKLISRREAKLHFGDALLVRGAWDKIELMRTERRNFTVVGSPDDLSKQVVALSPQAIIAVVALVGMVVAMVFSIVPTVIAALAAAVVMVLGGCLDMNQAYRSISWQSVVLIAAMIPMSLALQVTGGAELIANGLVDTVGAIGPLALLAGVFLLTTSFSQVINNTATAVLVAPIVLQAALVSGLSPYPLMMTVAVAASTACLTPIATTTNLMVMTPGGYRFNDFFKVGLPLMVLFLVVSLLLVPILWPF